MKYDFLKETSMHTQKKIALYIGEIEKITELEDKTILDMGCGGGELTKALAKENTVYGVDGDYKSLQCAQKYGLRARVADLNKKLSFKSNKIDIIIVKDILEHLTNVEKSVLEINRIAKNNAIVMIALPNEFGLETRIRVLLGDGIIKKRWFPSANELDNLHVRFFTKKGVHDLLARNYFTIIKDNSYTSTYLGLPFIGKIASSLFCGGITYIAQVKK